MNEVTGSLTTIFLFMDIVINNIEAMPRVSFKEKIIKADRKAPSNIISLYNRPLRKFLSLKDGDWNFIFLSGSIIFEQAKIKI